MVERVQMAWSDSRFVVHSLCEESYNEGELKKAKEIAFALAEEGMEIGKIARLVKVDVEDVQQWIDENMSVTK